MSKDEIRGIGTDRFFGLEAPRHIRPELTLRLTEHCFLPRDDDLQADWVASVAAPAFRLIASTRPPEARRSFCSIGTGAGVDALAAAEFLEARRIGITDVHTDVVEAAAENIRANLLDPSRVEILAGTGDLLSPLAPHRPKFDVIYENLPNVPLASGEDVGTERVSSGFFPPRPEPVPDAFRDNLLALHYVALLQARDFLAPGGVVLSMLGGRVRLAHFLDMAAAAGYRGSFLGYGWKVQNHAEEIVAGHLAWQKLGLGPFHFYPVEDLERVFAGIDPAEAAGRALAIEKDLEPLRIDAAAGAEILARGKRLGHTYAVLQSALERP